MAKDDTLAMLADKLLDYAEVEGVTASLALIMFRATFSTVSRTRREDRANRAHAVEMDKRYRAYYLVPVAQNKAGRVMLPDAVVVVQGLSRIPLAMADFARLAFGEAFGVNLWTLNERSVRVTLGAHGVASPTWQGLHGTVTMHIHNEQARAAMHLATEKQEAKGHTFAPGSFGAVKNLQMKRKE